jgi:intracellular multiplication protein IcmP
MAKQNSEHDTEGTLLAIALAVLIVAVMLWMIFGETFSSVMGTLRRYETAPFAFVFQGAADLHGKLVSLGGRSLDFSNTVSMLTKSGEYVRWLYIPIMIVLSVMLAGKSLRSKYQKQHTMASLAQQEAAIWPEIAPVAKLQDELIKGDIHAGPFPVSATEWEFAEKHKLALRQDGKLDRDRARDVFTSQLGPRWAGAEKLPRHARAVYACLLLFIVEQREEGLSRLRALASSYTKGGVAGFDDKFALEVIAAHEKNPLIVRAIKQHAYVFTLFATLLQLARQSGVLASPMFIWLKPVDRRLWYILNNVGRYAFHVECAGIAAHWLFEKEVGEACATPMLEKALDGLQQALLEYAEDDSLNRLYK